MTQFHERLWPSPLMFLVAALVIPASLLVMAPISMVAGWITAIILYLGAAALLLTMAPTVEIRDGVFRAGRARIDVDHLGHAQGYVDDEAAHQRGPALDARSYFLINGFAKQVVTVANTDPSDPAPYWLISTRNADRLAAALNSARLGG